MSHSDRVESIRSTLEQNGQSHLLAHWDHLNDAQRTQLLADIDQINFPAIRHLIESHVRHAQPHPIPENIEPPTTWPAKPPTERAAEYTRGRQRGIELIRDNRVAAFTVAGGQGTRLGFDGPKGAFPISPVKNKPLFHLFAEYIRGTNERYGSDLTWYIMTSPQNDSETRGFFTEHDHFGLKPDKVRFFQQGVMPAFSPEGKILLDQPHRIAFSPDGHGGSLLAMRRSGVLDEMAQNGVEHISYIQVDNPLVKLVDPLFIGLHELTGSEMSSKTVSKADDLERVGNFVKTNGQVMVIEYSDMPEELARSRDEHGNRRFDCASIAIHVLRRTFIEKLTADEERFALPWHRASKKVEHINEHGKRIMPSEPNAVKLESFIFDALPLSENPLILETTRADEFSPVKNATGVDSVETSKRDMNRRAAEWLRQAGCDVPLRDGEPDGLFELSPLVALDADHLREQMTSPPDIKAGEAHYWERF